MFDNFVPSDESKYEGVDSSSTQTQQSNVNDVQKEERQTTSAETVNTEDTSNLPFGKHPRFQELIKQKNEYKTRAEENEKKLKEYESKADKYKNYEALDNAMQHDPILNREINRLIVMKNEGKLTDAQFEAKVEKAQDASEERQDKRIPDPKVSALEEKVSSYEKRTKEQTFSLYKDAFDTLAENDYKDEADKALVFERTLKIFDKKYPNALDEGFRMSRIKEMYVEAKNELEGFSKRRMSGYVKEKTSDLPPSTKVGGSVNVEEDFDDVYSPKASRYVADGLKRMARG